MDELNNQATEIETEATSEILATETKSTDDIFLTEQTVVKRDPAKPNPFVQIIKGLAYFLVFIGAQVAATMIVMIYFGVKKAFEYASMGIQPAEHAYEFAAYMESQTLGNMNLILFINTGILLLALLIWFAIRKKNIFVETRIHKFSPKLLPVLLLITVGLVFFINSVLNLLPEAWIASYSSDSSFINDGTLLASMIAQALCAPLTEEISFRGLMLSRFNKGLPAWIGIVISSVLFGLVHGNAIWFVYAALLGAIFCLIANRTGSILPTLLLHILFNAVGTGLSYSGVGFTTIAYAIFALIGAGILAVGFTWFFKSTKSAS